MNLTIEIPEDLTEALKSEAVSRGLAPDDYVKQIVRGVLNTRTDDVAKPRKSLYGILAGYGLDVSEEAMD